LIGRAAYLQGVHDQFLQAKGESRYARVLEVPATRGKITDRQGDVLAVSSPVKSIWAIPEDARLNPSQTRQLAGLLEVAGAGAQPEAVARQGFRLPQAPGFARAGGSDRRAQAAGHS
jgi:cell division protein FtsI/penicillin-binding protein 2